MSIDPRSTMQPVRAKYPQLSRTERAAMALAAVLVSSTTLGGLLSMFQMRSEQSATAGTAVKTAPSTVEFAVRKEVAPRPRS